MTIEKAVSYTLEVNYKTVLSNYELYLNAVKTKDTRNRSIYSAQLVKSINHYNKTRETVETTWPNLLSKFPRVFAYGYKQKITIYTTNFVLK